MKKNLADGGTFNSSTFRLVGVDSAYNERFFQWSNLPSVGGGGIAGTKSVTSNYTVLIGDKNFVLMVNSASAVTITLPSSLGALFQVYVYHQGTGTITFAGGAGVTLRNGLGHTGSFGQYAISSAILLDTSTLVIQGMTA